MSNMKFEIVGTRNVCGREPGEIVTENDLVGVDVQHLVDAGHLRKATSKKAAVKTDSTELEED